ncbi:MAG: Lactoylglutathione lyase and related lyases [uncultured Microvirga sp.]|uniref:Lactoylglutathione lyase and related lyases n=1 Tax=uncultured Microvirga sp. TaxID=412392 RepID=A0A6J4MJ05_9HYPH|nr:MAG: Lactoylglutathione lyase and related lyases [uncultured Microvirga sp.]
MLDHVSITVTDMFAAERFYDAVMAALGVAKIGASERWIGYGLRADAAHPDRAYLALYRGERRPDDAHGRHWCFKAETRAAVDAFWRAGLAQGGVDDGAPGLRPRYHPDYYGAFLRDPDGNRVEAVCHRAEA